MSKRLVLRIAVFVSALIFLPPILLAQHRGGSHGGRGGGHGGFSGGHRGSSGGQRNFSGGHRGSSGGQRNFSGGHRGSSGGQRNFSGGHRGSSGGHRNFSGGHRRGGTGFGFGWRSPYYYSPYSYYGPYGGYGSGRYPYSSRGYSTQNEAAIDTDIAPEEAQVYLDGEYIGIADDFDGNPDYLYLEPGRYSLEFRLEGYETRSIDIEARPGTKLDLNQRLRRLPGAGRYSGGRTDSDPNALRFWGNNSDRSDPVAREPIDSEEAYGNSRDQRSLDGDRGSGTGLRLTVDPSDAAVYVDERFVGTAEEVNTLRRGIALTPGRHKVTVLRPGFQGKTVRVQIDGGKPEELRVSLSR